MKSRLGLSIILIALTGFATGAVAQSLLLGPRGEFRTSYGSELEYDPGEGCNKPSRPFTEDQFAWDMYRIDAERYLSCLEDTASSDLGYVRLVVQDGYDKAVQDFLDEVERGY